MIISELSVRRPVFAMVVSLLLTIIGLMAANRLAVREYPDHLLERRGAFANHHRVRHRSRHRVRGQ
jgi:hypothetical protein